VSTGTCSVTHKFDAHGNVIICSEAVDFLSTDAEGRTYLTGFGFCDHYDSAVWVGRAADVGAIVPHLPSTSSEGGR
jgi:uncharacterized ParB-like nuclease family protein